MSLALLLALSKRDQSLSFGVSVARADLWPKDNSGYEKLPVEGFRVVVEEIEGDLGWGLTDPHFTDMTVRDTEAWRGRFGPAQQVGSGPGFERVSHSEASTTAFLGQCCARITLAVSAALQMELRAPGFPDQHKRAQGK